MDGLNREKKEIYLAPTIAEDGEELLPRQSLSYDTLVLAIGSKTNDFGTLGVRENSIMLDSLAAAKRFHTKLVNSCLRAQAHSKNAGEGPFTVTIIGGGATGVELAAELHMTTKILSSYGLANFHPEKDLKIVIVDAAPRLLQMLPERLSEKVAKELRSIAIEVHTNDKVAVVSKEGVTMSSGTFIPCGIIVWAAGIKAPELLHQLDGLESNSINQLVVNRQLQCSRDFDIYALGDCCYCSLGDGKSAVPPRAQAAHQQANTLAKSIVRMLNGKSLLEFHYKDRGSLISLGNYTTVGSLMGALSHKSIFIEGTFAKWMYWSLHKHHQVVINGWFHSWLSTLVESIDRVRNPRIKLH